MPTSERRLITALLAALSAVPPLTINMYLAALPAMVVDLDTSVAMVQLTISMFFIAFAVSQLIYGPLADRYGRRPVLIGSLAVYALGSTACTLAPTVEWLIGARLLQAVGACGAPVLARAIVADLYGRERAARVLAYMGAVMGIAPALGPFAGGLIEQAVGWRGIFALLTGTAALLLLATWRLLTETHIDRDTGALGIRRILRNYSHLLGSRVFLGYALTLACAFSAFFSYMSSSPYIFIDLLGMEPESFGLLFLLTAGSWTVSSVVTGRVTAAVGVDRMLAVGCLLIAIAGAVLLGFVLAGVVGVVTLIVPMMAYAYGMGINIHNTMAGAVAPFRQMAGTASALLGFMQMGGAAVTTFVMGWAYDDTALPMAIGVAGFSSLGLCVFFLLIWRWRGQPA